MDILRDNWRNRLFHNGQMRRQQKEKERLKVLTKTADDFLQRLATCADLREMMHLHKDMWGKGIRNRTIAPNRNGIFRTKDILTMKPEEVFLGDLYGLWTFTIPTWEQQKGNRYGSGAAQWGISPDITLYEIVCGQYRRLLVAAVTAIRNEAETSLRQYWQDGKKS